MSNTCLITGGFGAIGIHLIVHLLENTTWDLIVLDSFKPVHKGWADRSQFLHEKYPTWRTRVRVITHDLSAPFTDREIARIGKVDYVVNLASRSDVQASIDDPIEFVRNNTDLMLHMLDFAVKVKPQKFIHFSTDEVYGPAPKDSKGHAEWSTILPSNPYSASKAAQEALAIAWWRAYNVPLIITNTMNNFGETQATSKFPAMIQQKLERDETITVHGAGGEIGSRYYIHSSNTADAVLFILENVTPHMHVFGAIDKPTRLNIVGDKQVSNIELVETIARLMGKEPKVEVVDYHKDNPGHDLHYGLDGTLLQSLGWQSPMTFEESLKQTIEWQETHRDWMS